MAEKKTSRRRRGAARNDGGQHHRAQQAPRDNNGQPTEALSLWADVTQTAMRDLMSVWTGATQESLRLATELQQANVEAARELGGNALRMQVRWPEMLRDPVSWYRQTLEESVDVALRGLALARRNAEGVTQAVERIQTSAQDATTTLHRTLRKAAGQGPGVERARAA